MFFNKDKSFEKNNDIIKITALLIHAAKIDENYSIDEKEIIKKAILEIGAENSDINEILKKAEEIEKNSNQILDFTKEVKNMNHEDKIKIIETLWRIIYSNKKADMYETNLMRRLTALLYVDNKIVGDIKNKISGENLK